jgi:hypothetical protein
LWVNGGGNAAQLDRGGKLAPALEGRADGSGLVLGDGEHALSMGAQRPDGQAADRDAAASSARPGAIFPPIGSSPRCASRLN